VSKNLDVAVGLAADRWQSKVLFLLPPAGTLLAITIVSHSSLWSCNFFQALIRGKASKQPLMYKLTFAVSFLCDCRVYLQDNGTLSLLLVPDSSESFALKPRQVT